MIYPMKGGKVAVIIRPAEQPVHIWVEESSQIPEHIWKQPFPREL